MVNDLDCDIVVTNILILQMLEPYFAYITDMGCVHGETYTSAKLSLLEGIDFPELKTLSEMKT